MQKAGGNDQPEEPGQFQDRMSFLQPAGSPNQAIGPARLAERMLDRAEAAER